MIGHQIIPDGKGGVDIADYGLDLSVEYTHLDKDDVDKIKKATTPECPLDKCRHYDAEHCGIDGCPYEECIRVTDGKDYFEPSEGAK